MSAHQYDEGHTVAGWTGFGIATVGTAVAGLGVCLVSGVLIVGGLAVVGVSVLVTWALHLSGWGKPPGRRPREEWEMRVRDSGAREGHEECVGCRIAGRRRERPSATAVGAEAGAGATAGAEAGAGMEAGAGARVAAEPIAAESSG
ncbi:HGxxPAAW family protein [Streptomyces sp. 351MFTsu5.1]|uniref:HGxxPAAW family protein n=1 Tax=Streptomyces sp. 351MFTsu5.1 TaxID=1172180 RepID=UPI0003738B6B|nr:HGxxPAAW family protein [Streptomyces sp. 351MFTsu5.1]